MAGKIPEGAIWENAMHMLGVRWGSSNAIYSYGGAKRRPTRSSGGFSKGKAVCSRYRMEQSFPRALKEGSRRGIAGVKS
jgi:hypothetical protein